MFDPLTLLVVGAGVLVFKEMGRKDYGILTASRDERYRNAMEHCYDANVLLQESKLFNDHGLKAQGAMLKRRAEWRSRTPETRKEHEAIFQKALTSVNIQGILEVAAAFEGWTATKKAAILRQRAQDLQDEMCRRVADEENTALATEKARLMELEPQVPTEPKVEVVEAAKDDETKTNGVSKASIPRNDSEGENATVSE